MAQTFTATKTFSRINLLILQFRTILKRTTNIDEAILSKLSEGVKKFWIKSFSVYGFDNNGKCHAQLKLEINWDEHNRQIAIGKTTVVISDKWSIENTSPEIDEAVRTFNEFIKDTQLRTDWSVSYQPEVYNDITFLQLIRTELGLITSEPIKWASSPAKKILSIEELPEINVGLYLAE